MLRQFAAVLLALPSLSFGDTLFSSVTVNVSEVSPPCSFSGAAPDSLSYACPDAEASGSASGTATPSMGSLAVMAQAFAGSPNFAEATSFISFSEPVIITGGTGGGFANFTFCFGPSSAAFIQSSGSFTFGAKNLGYGPFNYCFLTGPDSEALPFQFGQPFQETAVLRSDAVGAAHFDNATFTWTLNSITDTNGNVVNADIVAVPEPSTAWILMLGVALLALRKKGLRKF